MGKPTAHLAVNGTSATATDMSRAPDDRRALPQQFWAGFWTERPRALQRHIENAQASSSRPAPNVLLASTSPAGARGMVTRMAPRRPATVVKTMLTGTATDSPKRTRDYFFSPDTPAA